MENRDKKNIIGRDFEGWPIYKMTFREILSSLGASVISTDPEHTYYAFEDTDPLLDSFPVTLVDDGMGYGVDMKYVTEANKETYLNDGERRFNLFIEEVDEVAAKKIIDYLESKDKNE